MKLSFYKKNDNFYIKFVEGIYENHGRDGLCRLIGIIDVLDEIKIKKEEHVETIKNRKT